MSWSCAFGGRRGLSKQRGGNGDSAKRKGDEAIHKGSPSHWVRVHPAGRPGQRIQRQTIDSIKHGEALQVGLSTAFLPASGRQGLRPASGLLSAACTPP